MANLRADNLTGSGGRNAITGSVFFPENSYLEVTTTSDLALGAGDFTIETWVNFTKIDTYQCIIDFRAAGNGAFPFIVRDTDGDLYYYVNSGVLINNVPARANNCWHHIAVVRNSGTTKFYLNGVEEGSASDSTTYLATNNPTIGASTAESNDLFGYLSNLRIVKGTAVYTSTFTPPTEKLTAIEGTVLLCCQDSADPTQEATGKTINANGDILGRTETEYVVNGTFGGSGTSPGGASYSPAWTAWGDTTTARNGGIFIERTSTLTGVYQQLDQTIPVTGGQYRIRGTISNKTGPGGAIIRLSSASQGNGTNYFGAYGPGTIEHTFTYSGSGGLFMNLMIGNNTGSADFSNISFRNVVTGDTYNITPPVGIDEGVVIEGDTKVNSQGVMYFPTGDTSQRGRGRAVFAGGYTGPSPANGTTGISYFQIQSQGTMIDFGNLSEDRKFSAGLASGTRGVHGGSDGTPGWATGTMEYVTIATTSNTTTFGNMTQAGGMVSAHSNNTRGLFFSVWDANTSGASHKRHIDHITIATTGNSADFGELSVARPEATGFGSPTRGICSGGYAALSPNAALDTIDYVTIATTGDATDFGNLTVARQAPGGASSETRGITYAGYANPTQINVVDYVTIASTGNAIDFGDSFIAKYGSAQGNCSNKIRAVFPGGKSAIPAWTNSISYVDIATTGNGLDFGDLTGTYGYGSVCSDSHGGLS